MHQEAAMARVQPRSDVVAMRSPSWCGLAHIGGSPCSSVTSGAHVDATQPTGSMRQKVGTRRPYLGNTFVVKGDLRSDHPAGGAGADAGSPRPTGVPPVLVGAQAHMIVLVLLAMGVLPVEQAILIAQVILFLFLFGYSVRVGDGPPRAEAYAATEWVAGRRHRSPDRRHQSPTTVQ